jgi:23S rRNA pseudouridine2605 synthase
MRRSEDRPLQGRPASEGEPYKAKRTNSKKERSLTPEGVSYSWRLGRTMALERLQKIMAACGIASRRKAEEIIAAGRVTLNGKVVTELGTKADAERDVICVDGVALRKRERLLYFMLYKPKGYVTTVSDPEGRPTVMELMKKCPERVYPVGRLDYASEGLLLMTNDGALAQKLMKAGSHAPKTYLVKISGKPDERAIARLRAGVTIELEDGTRVKTSPAKIRLAEDGANPWYEVILIEGRNRQIRRMFQSVGFLVEKIKRVQLGPLVLDVAPGKFRALTVREVAKLKSLGEGSK